MKISVLAISRPVATLLLSIAITLSGLLALRLLPVSPLPQIDLPIIFVSASLPGASPETMAASVATPLERSLAKIAGVDEMTSSSSLGSTRIIIQFDIDRDINGAARDVQAAITAAQGMLPSGMPNRPSYHKLNPSDAPVMIITLASETHTQGELYDIASTQLAQKLSQVEGVGDVGISGSSLPAVRVSLNPDALFHQGVSLDAVQQAINRANQRRPLGAIEEGDQHWQVQTNDQLTTAEAYRPLIIHSVNGTSVRLSDVASVTDSVEDIRNAGRANGKPAVALIIRKSADANIIDTLNRIRAELPHLQTTLPATVDLNIAIDRSPTIRASLAEVERALMLAVVLVILVVWLFLGSARAALIPAVAVPISLIGSFTAIYLCGFSLNNLSLMALTVATGFVVDDAIVVLENITRYVEKGMKPHQAALKGAQEVSPTVVSMSLSLIAVFIPLLLLGGLPGRLFREFSVTLAVAIGLSLLISLTLTPMMCALLMKQQPVPHPQPHPEPQKQARWITLIQQGYGRSLGWALDHSRTILLLLLATIGLNIWLYIHIPKTFFPEQDTGLITGFIQADHSSSFQATRQKLTDLMKIVEADPDVSQVFGYTGGSQTNRGSMFISLAPPAERKLSAQQVITRLRTQLSSVAGVRLMLFPVQDIRAGGRPANAAYQYTLLSDDLDALRTWEPKIRSALARLPVLNDVNSDLEESGSELVLTYDRDTMRRLGISVEDANSLLNSAFGQRQISTIYQPLNQYKVVMEIDPRYTQDASALERMFVINSQGQPVPLSYFARWQPAAAPLSVNHEGLSAASTIAFNLPEGVPMSAATAAIERTMTELSVPPSVRGSYAGTAKLFQQQLESQLLLILAAIVTLYLLLGILYESYLHPLTILSTLPSAGVGALLALELFAAPFSLIAMIGVLLLIGIVMKNAIIMVDFALSTQRRGQGQGTLTARDAIFQACLLRFRPIIMTTLAAIAGAVPLIISYGNGAEMRQPLGITIMGGLIVSQILTLYSTPVIYLCLERLKDRFASTPSATSNAA